MRFWIFALVVVVTNAWSQSYPSKPVRVVIPYPPGSTPDLVGRTAAERLQKALGQPFVLTEHLKAVTPREILVRMCNNLLALFDRQKKMQEPERVATILSQPQPDQPIPLPLRTRPRLRRGDRKGAGAEIAKARKPHPAATPRGRPWPVGMDGAIPVGLSVSRGARRGSPRVRNRVEEAEAVFRKARAMAARPAEAISSWSARPGQ
mgnify:CR=1 FL=1